MSPALEERIQITGPLSGPQSALFDTEALRFLAKLHDNFDNRRRELLEQRRLRQREFDAGALPCFRPETAHIRQKEWKVAPIPKDLLDRRVEITGPVDRKMIINALNSGADAFMADFEDSNAPTWRNNVQGQVNLRDAVAGAISYTGPDGKQYCPGEKTATLMVRPRGWHLEEKSFLIEGRPIAGAFFDFGLFFFHNARKLIEKGTGPYFYLPKLESHLEARLWNDVFTFSQDESGIPRGSIRATVLIETTPAAFEMDEILYELRDHAAGLNCGRWDYIFSFIKTFSRHPDFLLPDRAAVTMDRHFLDSYVRLLIQTCHRRGAHAMGGMAAQIPIRNNPQANEKALDKVRQDKIREAAAGHDGTWVAHPGLVPVAREVFDSYMKEPNQISRKCETYVGPADLLVVPSGPVTEEGLRRNIDIGLQYLESWLRGNGCVPIYNLMEDAATAEICRAQVWQWLKHGATLEDGRRVTAPLVAEMVSEELDGRGNGKFAAAARIFEDLLTAREFPEFLTLAAYGHLD